MTYFILHHFYMFVVWYGEQAFLFIKYIGGYIQLNIAFVIVLTLKWPLFANEQQLSWYYCSGVAFPNDVMSQLRLHFNYSSFEMSISLLTMRKRYSPHRPPRKNVMKSNSIRINILNFYKQHFTSCNPHPDWVSNFKFYTTRPNIASQIPKTELYRKRNSISKFSKEKENEMKRILILRIHFSFKKEKGFI